MDDELSEKAAPEEAPAELPDEPSSGRHPPIQISLAGSKSGRYRVTIEALNGDEEAVSSQTITIAVPEAEGAPAPRPEPPPVESGLETEDSDKPGFRAGVAAAGARVLAWCRARSLTLGLVLFGLSLLLYLAVRLIALESFPIYFFTDEAVQTVLAADFLRDNFFGEDKVFFPTYFRNVYQFNLSTSVYLQILPYLFFGKSLFVTRA
ncbi:MAG: hypothetical protein R3335_11450, partial [Anaerolineales bacterium]|nr:hypothetical protein [Anaerolineales bacterium]